MSATRSRRAVLGFVLASAGSASVLRAGAIQEYSAATLDRPTPVQTSPAGRPATQRPSLALAIPQWGRLALDARAVAGTPASDAKDPMASLTALSFAAGGLRPFTPSGFSEQLLGRMTHEAGRFQGEGRHAAWSRLTPEDSAAEEERALAAATIITRSFKRTIDRRLEALAAVTPGLGAALEWAQSLGTRGRAEAPSSGIGARMDGGRRAPDSFSGSIRLRIDAHPKVQLGTEFWRFRGRVDVPILAGDTLHLSLERPLGTRGRAVLTSDLNRDGRDSTFLSYSFSY